MLTVDLVDTVRSCPTGRLALARQSLDKVGREGDVVANKTSSSTGAGPATSSAQATYYAYLQLGIPQGGYQGDLHLSDTLTAYILVC